MTEPSLQVERRMIVKGWKDDGYTGEKRKEFTSLHPDPSQRFIDFQRKRIGEKGLPGWQPHITEVIVEERVVTPWREV